MTSADLAKITLFQGARDAELRELAQRAERRSLPAEATFIREGERADQLFLILAGKVKVYLTDASGKKFVVDVRGAGQYVGEMMLDDRPRSASVRTVEPSELAVISRADFQAFLLKHPEVALQVIRNLIRITRTHNVRTIEDVHTRADLQVYIEQLKATRGQDLPSVKRWAVAKRWALVALLAFAIGQYYFLDVLLEMVSLGGGVAVGVRR
ncbi:MAG TPA: cyclic nucleotide-binding domain-containing protein [Burkholderiales bacterium]|nr:cyclic nucleotide-binding domain-containing protein [Burkholderiales bacterium]